MKKANINFLKLFFLSCQGCDSNLGPVSISFYLFIEHTKDLVSRASEKLPPKTSQGLFLTTADWLETNLLGCLTPLKILLLIPTVLKA